MSGPVELGFILFTSQISKSGNVIQPCIHLNSCESNLKPDCVFWPESILVWSLGSQYFTVLSAWEQIGYTSLKLSSINDVIYYHNLKGL